MREPAATELQFEVDGEMDFAVVESFICRLIPARR
jgi:hypothetical protein